MVDVSIITSYIDLILSFIFDHIGAIVAILIVFMGIRSSQKKKRAQAENNGETPKAKSLREIMAEMEAELNKADDEIDEEIDDEIEEAEPVAEGPGPRPYGQGESLDSPWQQREMDPKPKDTPWSMQEPPPEGPVREGPKPLIFPSTAAPKQPAVTVSTSASFGENAAFQSSLPLTRSGDIQIEAPPMEVYHDSDESGENSYFRKKKLNREEMIDAVVMAEILAKPKALRRAGQRL